MTSNQPQHELLDPPQEEGEIGRLEPYRVYGELGKGGMGVVFQARDGRLKRDVALKLMRNKIAGTSSSRKRFVEEARSMAAVHHDNVATIFEVGIHRGMPFMAMEMLRGNSLEHLLKGRKRLPYEQVLRLAKEVTNGLAAAHACGLVHRDIKPANIWIEEPTGRAKILDFGLAIAGSGFDQFSARGAVVGSPGYLAPEQARDEPVDNRTDLYALGVVLYQMCSGALPLYSKTIPGQLIAIICHTPRPLHERNPDVPGPLCDLIHRLIEKEPHDRPSSASQLAEMIDEVAEKCASESQQALTIVTDAPDSQPGDESGKPERTLSAFKKSPIPLLISVGVLLLLLVGLIWRSTMPNRVANTPASLSNVRPKPKPVSVDSLRPLALLSATGTDSVMAGTAARFKMRISNNAAGAANDPRTLNKGAKVAAQIVTLLTSKETSQVRRPTFPKKISATQLPPVGGSRELEIQFLTTNLPPATYNVLFVLQTPSGKTVKSINKTLTIIENLRDSDLLGFQKLRTLTGRGADTYVKHGSPNNHGGVKVLQTQLKGGPGGQEHIYLRFDLSKSQVPPKQLDRAALLLTLEAGGEQAKSTILAYGINAASLSGWSETDGQHLTWEKSPCHNGVGGQTYLGQVTIENPGDSMKDIEDGVRIFSQELDDFLRSAAGETITIALIRENASGKPTRFKSKEGKPKAAPAMAMRRK